jgi:hypothetical protein
MIKTRIVNVWVGSEFRAVYLGGRRKLDDFTPLLEELTSSNVIK